jgi:hypothetical protein
MLSEVEKLLRDIEILRKKLLYLIDKKQGDLLDDEVVTSSKILNAALNEYNKFIETKLNR